MTFPKGRCLIGGHRGAPRVAPENTRVSFERAVFAGVDFIETDVRLSKDNVPILIHDAGLKRTTNGDSSLTVYQQTLKQLQALDAGSWFGSQFAGEQIPTLEAILRDYGQQVCFMLELKSGNEEASRFVDTVYRVVHVTNCSDRIMLTSFDQAIVIELLKRFPSDQVAGIAENQTQLAGWASFSLNNLAIHHSLMTHELCGRARLWVWTVNELAEAARFAALGVAGIITDELSQLRSSDFASH